MFRAILATLLGLVFAGWGLWVLLPFGGPTDMPEATFVVVAVVSFGFAFVLFRYALHVVRARHRSR